MRKKVVAGNWKMNLTKSEALTLYQSISKEAENVNCELAVFSSYIFLDALKQLENSHVSIGAQNFHQEPKGAFTGEVSFTQLKDLGIQNVLIGHSERRMLCHEDDAIIKAKIDVAMANGFQIIYCCGEPLNIRENNQHIDFVLNQLKENVLHLSESEFSRLIIAYEPIWAIGTGKTATPDQAEEIHAEIRKAIAQNYSEEVAAKMSILYGGSCNAKNAHELFAKPNIDGGLIGGASLKADEFIEIAKSF